ncbi:uncharacterized protein DEA37_0009834 [Paragonimus westermani]|uniref:Uncharacterized protein n=1 Tax=Paragonimus westermani TaxID=34504 RepID=A0A5J4P4A4_9TREM|nr:uncharacterized protein DEA37_0009834 [Paragonimus westermani]
MVRKGTIGAIGRGDVTMWRCDVCGRECAGRIRRNSDYTRSIFIITVAHSLTAMSLQSSHHRRKNTTSAASNGTRTNSERSRPRQHEAVRRIRRGYFSLGRHMHINETEPSRPLSLLDSSRPIRMDQPRLVVIDRQETIVPGVQPVSRNTQSVSDRSYYFEPGSANETDEERRYPVLSFQYAEPHTVELLVVVTERMRRHFGTMINDYLTSTMTTVSSLLRHPSLKTSIQLNIVDIILLDRAYASRHNLEDWSYSKQEQVMARFCRWVNRLRRPTFNWDSAILLNVG